MCSERDFRPRRAVARAATVLSSSSQGLYASCTNAGEPSAAGRC